MKSPNGFGGLTVDRIVLDAALVDKLRLAARPVELCDDSGSVIGLFSSIVDPSEYKNWEPEISDEELKRRVSSTAPRYSTAEVLRYLEDL